MIIVLESLQSTTDPVEVDEKLPSEFHLESYELLKSEHTMMQIQELPDQNLNESAMNCETSDLLLNSEQNLMLPKQNCSIPTESIGETFVDYVQKRNFENEKRAQSIISTLEPVPVSMKAEITTQSPNKKYLKPKEVCCNYCTSRFTEQKNLNRHVKVKHHNVRPFSCESCKKAFES